MHNELDEEELARHCCSGDKMAEDELYRRYAARVYTLCRRYVGDNEAEDLMQESLVQALDKIHTFQFKGQGSLYGWIGRIAINKAVNYNKRQRWRMVSLDFVVYDNIPEPNGEEVDTIPQEKLLDIISGLPGLRRTVFNMYCIDGYSHREIGEMLGISEKGSAGVLAKARKQLKVAIQKYLKESER